MSRLGPKWFWVDSLTPQKLAEGLLDALKNIELYTRNAEALAKEMAKDDAVGSALEVLDKEAAEACKARVTFLGTPLA